MASDERTQSDVESDEEFEETMTFRFKLMRPSWACLTSTILQDELTTQLNRKRLDRIDKILEVLVANQNFFYSPFRVIDNFLRWEAFESMPIGECSELLRIIFRHGGQNLQGQTDVQDFVIEKAVFYNDHESLDTLREIFGRRCVDKAVVKVRGKFRCRSPLLSASLRGDVAKVERLLARAPGPRAGRSRPVQERTGFFHLLFEEDDVHPATAAADFGHTAVVDALLARLPRPSLSQFDCWRLSFDEVWSIACHRSNFAMAASVLSAMGIPAIRYEEVSKCLVGTAEFFRDVLSLIRTRLSEAGRKFRPDWLTDMLNDAIYDRQRHHVRALLDEIDQDRSLFFKLPWSMRTFLHSRSAAILRDVLIRHPEAPTRILDCDPLRAIQDYHWAVGARLLVEAGAKIEGPVPPKFVGLLSLSLEDRCRIVVRRHTKLPLSQNVDQLPLPRKVKRRLLYRRV